ncbi:MAG: hypothetical protein ACRBC3_04410 [Burkholderiaceae bacterium]
MGIPEGYRDRSGEATTTGVACQISGRLRRAVSDRIAICGPQLFETLSQRYLNIALELAR